MAAYEPRETSLNVNPDLLSGFLDAMETFSDELKNPVQEITFSNWIIYINKGLDFTIRLITAKKHPKDQIDKIFQDLRAISKEVLPKYTGGRTVSSEDINKYYLPILQPVLTEQSIETITQIETAKPPNEVTSRISLAGLGDVGKTSIKRKFLENFEPEQALKTRPTLGVEMSKKNISFLQETLNVQEFGGQALFRQKYISNKMLWDNISTLIYVVDLTKPLDFIESREYLRTILGLMGEANTIPYNVSLFLHKYDPGSRPSLAENLKQCLEVFSEFEDKVTIHLTSLMDNSSNIAMIKSIYLYFPAIMLQRMLEEEFLKDIKTNLLPRFIPLISDPNAPVDDELADEIKSSAILFGRSYGNKFQTSWINYLTEPVPTGEIKPSESIIVKKEGNGILVTVKKDAEYPNLHTLVVFGALTGMARSLLFQSPKMISQTDTETTWQIQF